MMPRDAARAGAAVHDAQAADPGALLRAQRLARAAQLVNASLDLDVALERALALALEVLGADRATLVLAGGSVLHQPVPPRQPLEADHERAIDALVADIAATGEPLFAPNGAQDERLRQRPELRALGRGTIACLPLASRGAPLGALYLEAAPSAQAFAGANRETIVGFTHQVALAIENAQLVAHERERVARISALQAFQTRILEAIASGVITFSPLGEITTFNRAAEATFGIPADQMLGRAARAIARVIPDFPELFETFHASGAVQLRAEVEAQRTDGAELTLEMQLAPLHQTDGTGVAMAVTDVTKQRRLEIAHEADIEKAGRIERTFGRYLAPHVVASLMHDPDSVKLGGERRRATMFFADVRGFTRLAAQLPPDRVVHILNAYFEKAVGIVFEHDGLLDKFYGDGLMAVFGAPRARTDDAARAVAAAIELHTVVAGLGPRLNYPLQISVGLATGDVVAGHFGSSQRMDYTVIGDAVNLANGLQAAAPPGAIYCDETTIREAGPLALRAERLAARVKGRAEPVIAYAIVR